MTAGMRSASPATDRHLTMDNRIKGFILRGLGAGAAGGAAAALFLRFVTETQIGHALRFEEATGIGLPPGEAAEFSRGTQQWGGMIAAVIYGAALGLVLGIAVAALHHRVAGRNEFERALKISAAAFVALVLIPALKYPPNPPTVGDPDTINERTTAYLLLLAASIVIVAASWQLWVRLTERGWTGAPRFIVGAGSFVLVVGLTYMIWPASPDRIGAGDNEAAPALQISDDAPTDVLATMLQTARATDDTSIRDPANPEEPVDLSTVSVPEDLRGAPVAVSTTKLVPNAYTTVVWHFRVQSIAGLALMWAVMAAVFGLLADAPAWRTNDAAAKAGEAVPLRS
jgi:hypothetical protein